ncbi:MAG: 8-oxo-dGTP diphosphatase [Limisphaerales bacterium]|jgi:8-oxo-dGTP diphosphatase
MINKVKPVSGVVNSHVSVDCVIFGFDFEELKVLLIQRKETDKSVDGSEDIVREGSWALPGNLILEDESLDQGAERALVELTGLDNIYLEQFRAFGNPDRVRKPSDVLWLKSVRQDPSARVITVAYFSLVKLMDYNPNPSSFATRVEWFKIGDVPELAFDHNEIVDAALEALKSRLRRRPVGFALLPPKFTLGQLQKLYEAILRMPLDKRNFRKKMLKKGILIALDEKQQGVPHKPAQYYQFDREKYLQLTDADFDFAPLA